MLPDPNFVRIAFLGVKKGVNLANARFTPFIAEREGFEPPVQLPVHRISSAARSTTPASFPCFADERVSAYGLQK